MRLPEDHEVIAIQVERVYRRRRIIYRPGKRAQKTVVVVEPATQDALPPPELPERLGSPEETARAVQLAGLRRRLGLPARGGRRNDE